MDRLSFQFHYLSIFPEMIQGNLKCFPDISFKNEIGLRLISRKQLFNCALLKEIVLTIVITPTDFSIL